MSDEIIETIMQHPTVQATLLQHTISITQTPLIPPSDKLRRFLENFAKKAAALVLIKDPPSVDTSEPSWRNQVAGVAAKAQKDAELAHFLKMQGKKLCRRFENEIGGELGKQNPKIRPALVDMGLLCLAIDMGQYAVCAFHGIDITLVLLTAEHYEHRVEELWGATSFSAGLKPVAHYIDPHPKPGD